MDNKENIENRKEEQNMSPIVQSEPPPPTLC